ncbi:M24 family metallopeptidase [Sphingomonas sp. HT-1]|uniref:M24 family metallopeptidase n=1 Tax=unclassified Sphingomonas TaxID=196159 RepID=UPI0002FDFACA|nr:MULTISPECIES: Xaa-Pro peptidase family protein [unclassified Sphingomonas]KTF70057.1 X-Pro dipeptidase [Sphingomonas sp. WG]
MTIGGSNAAAELAALVPWGDRAPAITEAERLDRIARVRARLETMGAQALLVNAGMSLRYFAGVPWGATERLVAMLLPLHGEPIMICPRFELGSLSADMGIVADMRLWEEDEDPFALVADALGGVTTLAVDPALPFQMAERLRRSAPGVSLVDGAPAIDGCRMRKSPAEIALMQQAKAMTLAVHHAAARILEPGITTGAVKRFIDQAHRALGAAGSSFCIVQFGRATAFPHGLPGEQALEEGQLVLIDTGCTVEGYHSDITRTYAFGRVSDQEQAIWALEKEAQAAAFEAAELGAPCERVDMAARAVLEKAGLGPDYRLPGLPHRTGHGIGLSIHEPAYLVRGDRTPLDVGMCFSNEPMIVVPDRFGVRLEDHFHMTDTGPRWFTEPQAAIDRLA